MYQCNYLAVCGYCFDPCMVGATGTNDKLTDPAGRVGNTIWILRRELFVYMVMAVQNDIRIVII